MASTDPLLGKKLGDYVIQSLLGKGGMARVYQGYDENLDRYAAIKIISGDFATEDAEEYNERFLKEARAIARLNNQHIVGVYQFGNTEGVYYMAMHFLDGEDLRAILRSHAKQGQIMSTDDIVGMARDMAAALDYAHKEGVVHRDIKPSNIMILNNDGKSVLTDFGLALSVPEGTMGDTFGTAHYIAPEQAISSANAVPQSDLYSLGVVLYEAFTGKVPFDEPSAMSVALKHLNEPPPLPSLFNPNISPELEKVLLTALNKDPQDRYQTGKELVAALEAAIQGTSVDSPSGLTATDDDYDLERSRTLITSPNPSALRRSEAANSKASLEDYLKRVEETSAKRPESLGRPPTDFTPPPYNTQTYPSALYPPQPQNNNMWIFAIIGFILVIGIIAALLLSNQSNDDDGGGVDEFLSAQQTLNSENNAATETRSALNNRGTQTQVAIVAANETATATLWTNTPSPTNTPTNTSTPTPTNTPTDTPTQTNTPTDTPTDTPTITPTEAIINTPTITPTPLPTFLPADVRFEYIDDWLLIENPQGGTVNVSDLRIEWLSNGIQRVLDFGIELADVPNYRALPASGCLQIVAFTDASTENISDICGEDGRRFGWIFPGTTGIFWQSGRTDTGYFEVFVSRRRIAYCPLGETTCEFSLSRQPIVPGFELAEAFEQLTEEPTEVTTEEPTEVATEEPTEEPTEITTEEPTEEPTEVATEEPTEEISEATLVLVYNDRVAYLQNISDGRLNITRLLFERTQENGRVIDFAASEWSGNLATFPAGGCYQAGISVGAASAQPASCSQSLGWSSVGTLDQFWRMVDGGGERFVVIYDGEEIATCKIEAGRCEFSLPE